MVIDNGRLGLNSSVQVIEDEKNRWVLFRCAGIPSKAKVEILAITLPPTDASEKKFLDVQRTKLFNDLRWGYSKGSSGRWRNTLMDYMEETGSLSYLFEPSVVEAALVDGKMPEGFMEHHYHSRGLGGLTVVENFVLIEKYAHEVLHRRVYKPIETMALSYAMTHPRVKMYAVLPSREREVPGNTCGAVSNMPKQMRVITNGELYRWLTPEELCEEKQMILDASKAPHSTNSQRRHTDGLSVIVRGQERRFGKGGRFSPVRVGQSNHHRCVLSQIGKGSGLKKQHG